MVAECRLRGTGLLLVMHILFDHQAFTMQKYGGVSRCFVELYKQLAKENNVTISVRETSNSYMREIDYGFPSNYDYTHFLSKRNFPGKVRLFALRNSIKYRLPYSTCLFPHDNMVEYGKLESIKALKKGRFDIFHPTFFDDYFLPYLNGKPFVLTIHDMIPELYPQYFNADNDLQILGKRKLAPLASAIVTVSEKTKEDVVNILGVPEDKVHVIYHGSEHIKSYTYEEKVIDPYILYVGERDCYKDFDLFLDNSCKVLLNYPELKVYCTGKSFTENEMKHMAELGVQDHFVYKWIANDNEMSELYHNAKCFIYPSEYEGFGIPILEAYAADCPVLLNYSSCFPEIAEDAAVYFTFDTLADQLESILSMSQMDRETLISKQRSRLKMYSWEKSAKALENIYRSII